MRMHDIISEDAAGVGKIVKGVNTTPDVGPNEIKKQAAKFGNKVSKTGVPKNIAKTNETISTGFLFDIALTEGYKLQLERDKNIDILHIVNTKTGQRTEVRGRKGYESGNYNSKDRLHQVLDNLKKSVDFSELMNGNVVTINPHHPHADHAKVNIDNAFNEELTPLEKAALEGGHTLSDIYDRKLFDWKNY